jgi:Mrp family chromosome partitioning ATPase
MAEPARARADDARPEAEDDSDAKGAPLVIRPTEEDAPVYSDQLLEHFRRTYLSIEATGDRTLPQAIGVTSAGRREGRTTIAAGIASAMAADLDVPVVLVEVDLTHPGIHRVFGIHPKPGISEYLRGECEVANVIRHVSEGLFVIPAGDARGEAPRLIRQLATADLPARLDASGAVLVLDLPPIKATSFGALACSMAESILFVVRAGTATIPDVKDSLARLDPAVVRSVVLNGAQSLLPRRARARGGLRWK